MTRVDDNHEAERAAARRRVEDLQRARQRDASDAFRKLVADGQASAGQARRRQDAGGDERRQAHAREAASATTALLARQGIRGRDLSRALQHRGDAATGERTIENGRRRAARAEDERTRRDERRAAEPDERPGAREPVIDEDGGERRGPGGQGDAPTGGGGMDPRGQPQLGGSVSRGTSGTASFAPPRLSPQVLQRLVERLMAGVTPAGRSLVTIQLGSDVLGGATVDVTGENGEITCTFHTADRSVRRLLEASEGALARALERRSLRLASLRVVGTRW